jgi:hypothetical protein
MFDGQRWRLSAVYPAPPARSKSGCALDVVHLPDHDPEGSLLMSESPGMRVDRLRRDGWVDLFVANSSLAGPLKCSVPVSNAHSRVSKITYCQHAGATISGAWVAWTTTGSDLLITNCNNERPTFRNDERRLHSHAEHCQRIRNHHGGVWGDVDADGWLDLFVVNFEGEAMAQQNPMCCITTLA